MRRTRTQQQQKSSTSTPVAQKASVLASSYNNLLSVILLLASGVIVSINILHMRPSLLQTSSGSITSSTTTTATNTTTSSRTHAIIHLGPHKTGTSSIQTISLAEEMKLDGYEMPWTNVNPNVLNPKLFGKYPENQWNFATCFLPDDHPSKIKHPCVPQLLDAGISKIAAQRKNLFISSETLSFLEPNGIQNLSNYLMHQNYYWDDVTIIITYRRFYDLIQSLWNEDSKPYVFNDMILPTHTKLDFLQRHNKYSYHRDIRFLIWKFKKRFDNVIVLNYHDTSHNNKDIVETFYCDAIPNADLTCATLKNVLPKLSRQNVAPDNMIYGQLALGAANTGLIKKKKFHSRNEFKDIVNRIRYHHEKELGLTKYDLTTICPPQDVLDGLLDKTIEIEKSLFPNFFNDGELGENALRADFEKQKTTKLCDVDINATLSSSEWQIFFQSLADDDETITE